MRLLKLLLLRNSFLQVLFRWSGRVYCGIDTLPHRLTLRIKILDSAISLNQVVWSTWHLWVIYLLHVLVKQDVVVVVSCEFGSLHSIITILTLTRSLFISHVATLVFSFVNHTLLKTIHRRSSIGGLVFCLKLHACGGFRVFLHFIHYVHNAMLYLSSKIILIYRKKSWRYYFNLIFVWFSLDILTYENCKIHATTSIHLK